MSESWVPLHLRSNDGKSTTGAVEGVPSYMAKSIWKWVDQFFIAGTGYHSHGYYDHSNEYFNLDRVREIELALRKEVPIETSNLDFALDELHQLFTDEDGLLDLVHHLLSLHSYEESQLELEEILRSADSAWRVDIRDEKVGLVRRVLPELEDTLRKTADLDPQASKFLADAYANTYGREPNYDYAVNLAIKAVEQASIPRMEIDANTKTLGRVIEHLKEGKFGLLVPMPDKYDSARYSVLADACEILWRSNTGRHGGKSEKEILVSKEQAEVAVTLATTLVYLITSPGLAGVKSTN